MNIKRLLPWILFLSLIIIVATAMYIDKHSAPSPTLSHNETWIKGIAIAGNPQKLEIGTEYSIGWDSSKDVRQVTIILERKGQFVKPALWIIENIKGAKWTPDKNLTPGDGYQIKVIDHGTGISVMSQVFAIEPYPCDRLG